MTAVLGLDIGGTGTRAVLSAGGRTLGDRSGGSANPAAVGWEAARTNLREVVAELPVELMPEAQVLVVTDARLVLAAAGLDAGVALVAGTGSIAFGRGVSGREARAGGWGHLLGDEGSGYWIVREAARQALRAEDTGAAPSHLHRALFAEAGAATALELGHLLHEEPDPGRWAALAPHVLASTDRDPGAAAIVRRGAAGLAGLALRVRERLGEPALPVVLAGGLLLGTPWLEWEVRDRLPGPVSRLEQPAVLGAVRLAETLLRA